MDKKRSVLSGLFWTFGERIGAQLVSFVVSVILARILAPSEYGVIAMVNVFIAIANVFVSSGFGNALIQKKKADSTDYSTIFYFQILISIVLYLILFFAAPYIADFYGEDYEILSPVLRVLGLSLILGAVNNVQKSYVSKHMMFKKFFFATLGGTVISAIISIFMAYNGAGIWALVAQSLINSTIDTVILWITVKWRPTLSFSFKRLKGLFAYSWKLLISALLDTGYNQLRNLIIGKLYTSEDLAYYNKGDSYPSLIVTNINSSIDSVLFPVMSSEQDSKEAVKNMTRRAIKTSCYIMAPLMMGLAAVAEPIISLMLTDKWLPCVPYLRIFCITYMFYPIHTANLNAIKAMGRSDIFLKLEIIKKAIGLALLLTSMNFGVMAMAYSLLVSCVASQIINSWPNRKLLNYGYLEQLKDILPGILLAVFMGVCVYFVQFLNLNTILTLCIQVVLGAAIYIGGSVLFKMESFTYLWNMVKPALGKVFHKKSRE